MKISATIIIIALFYFAFILGSELISDYKMFILSERFQTPTFLELFFKSTLLFSLIILILECFIQIFDKKNGATTTSLQP